MPGSERAICSHAAVLLFKSSQVYFQKLWGKSPYKKLLKNSLYRLTL